MFRPFRDEFRDVFYSYHHCDCSDSSGLPKIYHGNGGAQIPQTEEDEIWMFGKEAIENEKKNMKEDLK